MEITLTWHWWYVPVLIIISGVIWARIYEINNPNNGGMFPDIAPALIVIGSFIAAVAVTIGHFI
jgi:hypothetical protein